MHMFWSFFQQNIIEHSENYLFLIFSVYKYTEYNMREMKLLSISRNLLFFIIFRAKRYIMERQW